MSDSESDSKINEILTTVKNIDSMNLFKVLKAVISELERKSKQPVKEQKAKKGSMPKGVIPPQLMKPRAWVEYTLKDARENGWEIFSVKKKKKDKESGIMLEEIVTMPCSSKVSGVHIYEGSVTETVPTGRQIIHKEAMSLSKQRKENGHSSYALFESQYGSESKESESEPEPEPEPEPVQKTVKIVKKKNAK